MAFQVSPGINISEIDLTTVTPAIATTVGAVAGVFAWGPIGKIFLVDSENTLVARYGKPNNNNYETFFTAANFLAYGNRLYVSRAAVTSGFSNSVSVGLNGNTTILVSGNNYGVAAAQGVYGEGIPAGATVVSAEAANSTGGTGVTAGTLSHTLIVLSSAATLGNSTTASTQTVNFYDRAYSFNAVANSSTAESRSSYIIKNSDHFENVTIPTGIEFVARYPGELGNSLKVSVCDSAEQYQSVVNPYALTVNSSFSTNSSIVPGTSGIAVNVNESSANVYIANSANVNFAATYVAAGVMRSKFTVGDYIEVGNTTIGKQFLKIKEVGTLANTGGVSPTGTVYFNLVLEQPYKLSTNYQATSVTRNWEYFNLVDSAPGTSDTVAAAGRSVVDEVSVVVADEDGAISGVPGTVLEIYQNLSRATDSKKADGSANFYKTVINDSSRYLWLTNDRTEAASATAALVAGSTATKPYTKSFIGGADGKTESDVSVGALAQAYDVFADPTAVDISLVLSGKATGTNGTQLANYLIDNIAESRKDCVVFVSPKKSDVVGAGVDGLQASNVITFRNNLRSSSYAVIDSGYKYQYDKYNDVYRYVPLNGDTAGLAARTDDTRDPWWSPAGFTRGQIRNLVKLAWNPNKGDRDLLYKNDINPVVTFPGQGTILYGDKTALGKPSAFDRINVRRLFIVLEKTIATAAQQMLFEFNDEFTRAQFKNLVEPFLRDVQGRRGIYDFRVVCDETNNTPEVVDTNRFVGDIYIKPAKSINFIQLNFVAVRSGVEFTEVVGQF